MYNNDIVIENFINFCDNMIIAEEMYKDITSDFTKKQNLKYNEDKHEYEIPGKSIYNSSIELSTDYALSDEEFKSLDKKIKRALNVIKSWQPVNYAKILAKSKSEGLIVPSEADLKSQINKFDNKLILIYSKSRPELLRVEIGIFCPFKSKDPEGDLLNFGAINDGIAFGYDICEFKYYET